MRGFDAGRIQTALQRVSFLGKTVAIGAVQKMLMPHILDIFADHDADELRQMIQANYALVEKQTPDGVKQALDNLGSNPELREQWEDVVVSTVTPENILHWLRNPEAWLDADEAAAQRAELKRCADVIEKTARGERWLEDQVLEVYRLAHIVPREAPAARADG